MADTDPRHEARAAQESADQALIDAIAAHNAGIADGSIPNPPEPVKAAAPSIPGDALKGRSRSRKT